MDFLTFKKFISTEALILFYYTGALLMPVGIWVSLLWLTKKYKLIHDAYQNTKDILWKSLTLKQQIKFISFFILCILFAELFWRMLFEFLIAYMQIRDALLNTQF
ncbi:MAG: hypothetical protein DIZ80_17315 [endosymbiont of Galathealinum brachiosum]|uniref:DUF4282 domain-containing protein n=1 Tax=endosymbiont of Galathealinum brachiosum TaxID=2200906 RepID=A0A370D700_9GAMM|nr:MAG: hypothetical protein DIZ80_17315 [endosymbiont of Galathealinum brachiosum]